MKLLKVLIPVLLLAVGLSGCDGIQGAADNPEILSFAIEAGSANPAIPADIEGVIVERADGGTVTVTVPEAFDFANELVPTITVSSGASLSPGSGVSQDFSLNPLTYTVYNSDGSQRVYDVIAKRAVAQAPSGSVFISEVYNGKVSTETTGTRVDNSYIELYNSGAADYDLSQFSLRFHDSRSTDSLSLDFTVPLEGTIAAGSTFVIYNQFVQSTKMGTVLGLASTEAISDLYLNGITAIDGNDAIELLQNGEAIDIFDPSQARDYLPAYTEMKKFVRKGTKNPSLLWEDFDWIMYPLTNVAADDDTAGAHSDVVASEAKDLTYFAFEEGFDEPVLGDIDETDNSVFVIFPAGTDATDQRAVFGTSGKSVTVSSRVQRNAETANDFTGDVTYTVWAENGGTKNYSVSSIVLEPVNVTYTTSNYDFDGNIQAVLDAIGSSGSDVNLTSVKGAGYSGDAGTVTGIVTAKDIYGHSTAKKAFFLQDKDAGLYFFSNEGLESYIEMGSKITITVSTGKVYYGMPEITAHGSASIIEQNIPIYYETGSYANSSALGKVFLYEGPIETSMDGFSVGLFTGDLNFHSDRDFEDQLAAGNSGKFYGPITYSYSLYRMEIISSYQIVQ